MNDPFGSLCNKIILLTSASSEHVTRSLRTSETCWGSVTVPWRSFLISAAYSKPSSSFCVRVFPGDANTASRRHSSVSNIVRLVAKPLLFRSSWSALCPRPAWRIRPSHQLTRGNVRPSSPTTSLRGCSLFYFFLSFFLLFSLTCFFFSFSFSFLSFSFCLYSSPSFLLHFFFPFLLFLVLPFFFLSLVPLVLTRCKIRK